MKLIALLVSILLAFETSVSFAQVVPDPDLIRVESARAYSGALEDGDMLVPLTIMAIQDDIDIVRARRRK